MFATVSFMFLEDMWTKKLCDHSKFTRVTFLAWSSNILGTSMGLFPQDSHTIPSTCKFSATTSSWFCRSMTIVFYSTLAKIEQLLQPEKNSKTKEWGKFWGSRSSPKLSKCSNVSFGTIIWRARRSLLLTSTLVLSSNSAIMTHPFKKFCEVPLIDLFTC